MESLLKIHKHLFCLDCALVCQHFFNYNFSGLIKATKLHEPFTYFTQSIPHIFFMIANAMQKKKTQTNPIMLCDWITLEKVHCSEVCQGC